MRTARTCAIARCLKLKAPFNPNRIRSMQEVKDIAGDPNEVVDGFAPPPAL
jgi:hypothetical protein